MKPKMKLDDALLLSYTWNGGRGTWLCLCASACSLCAETFSVCLVTSHKWGGRKTDGCKSREMQRGEMHRGKRAGKRKCNMGKKEKGKKKWGETQGKYTVWVVYTHEELPITTLRFKHTQHTVALVFTIYRMNFLNSLRFWTTSVLVCTRG